MNILITGNMGYVGPQMVRHFAKAFDGAKIYGLDVSFFGHCLTPVNRLPEALLDKQVYKDVRDVTAADLEGIDAIVHLAAISNDPMGNAYEAVTEEINQRASVKLAETAKQAGVGRFVFASSCSVYGAADTEARTETSEVNPLTAYARSKIGTEQDVAHLADDSFIISCLRFPTACGMSDRLRLDLVLNDFVASAVASGQIEILSDGSPWRPLIDTKDMSRAAEWAIKREREAGGEFLVINTGRTEWNYQVKDLARAVQSIVPNVEVSINQDAPEDKRSYQEDFSQYADLAPNHLPQVALEQSISELYAGLSGMNFSVKNFRDSHWMRLKVLNHLRETQALNGDLRFTQAA